MYFHVEYLNRFSYELLLAYIELQNFPKVYHIFTIF